MGWTGQLHKGHRVGKKKQEKIKRRGEERGMRRERFRYGSLVSSLEVHVRRKFIMGWEIQEIGIREGRC